MPAALLRVQTLPDGMQIGWLPYGDRFLQRQEAVALDPFHLSLAKEIFELAPGVLATRCQPHQAVAIAGVKTKRLSSRLFRISFSVTILK